MGSLIAMRQLNGALTQSLSPLPRQKSMYITYIHANTDFPPF